MSWCKSLNYKSCLFAGCAAVHESRVHLRLPHSGLSICCNPRAQHWACVRVSRRAPSDSGADARTELQARGSRWRGERKKMRQKGLGHAFSFVILLRIRLVQLFPFVRTAKQRFPALQLSISWTWRDSLILGAQSLNVFGRKRCANITSDV